MPTIRLRAEPVQTPAGHAVNRQSVDERSGKPLLLVKSGIPTVDYIVDTVKPGGVTYISDEDYYNPHLWREYQGL